MTKPPIPCGHCAKPVPQPPVGRPKRFCNPNCKQAHWRKTHKPEEPVEVVTDDNEPEAVIDLDVISIAQLRGEASVRGLRMDGDREDLIVRILRHDGIELPEDEPEEPEPVEVSAEPVPSPLRKWQADPKAPSPRPAPAPRPRPRVRESW